MMRALLALLGGLALAGEVFSQALPAESPFVPKGGAAAASGIRDDPNAAFSLVGVVADSARTMVSIRRSTDQHSFWIPVGGTVNDVTAVSYDPASETAVIQAGGQSHTLSLRRATVAAASRAANQAATNFPVPALDEDASPAETSEDPAENAPDDDSSPSDENAVSVASDDEDPAPDANPEAEEEYEARMLVSDLMEIGQRQREAYEAANPNADSDETVENGADEEAGSSESVDNNDQDSGTDSEVEPDPAESDDSDSAEAEPES